MRNYVLIKQKDYGERELLGVVCYGTKEQVTKRKLEILQEHSKRPYPVKYSLQIWPVEESFVD